MKVPRCQPPAFSPIDREALGRGVRAALMGGTDTHQFLTRELRRRYAADTVTLCGTGTQALQLALTEALSRTREARLVALPAFSCFDLASAAVGADCRVLLYDLDPNTLSPDLESLERALRAGAGVVVVSPLYGVPVDWAELWEATSLHGARLIEDAAQGHGARWRQRPLGSLGELSVLSFGRGKGWTGGGGGALLRRGGAAPGDLSLSAQGLAREMGVVAGSLVQWAFGRPSLYQIPLSIPQLQLGETRYRPPTAVQAMARASAELVLRTRRTSDEEAQFRRVNAGALLEELSTASGAEPIAVPSDSTAGFLRLPVRIRGGISAFTSRERAHRLGVRSGYPCTLGRLHPIQERLAGPAQDCPGAEQLVRELVTLPTHSQVPEHERIEILDLLREVSGSTSLVALQSA